MSAKKMLRRQSGWALLEAMIATVLLSFVVMLALAILQGVNRQKNSNQPLEIMRQGQLALTGYALLHQKFPMPYEPVKKPGRPNYWEGWLPKEELGLPSGAPKIRYLVHSELVTPPKIYNPDPIGLTNGMVIVRTQPGSVDFCASLLQRELMGESLPNGFRTAFAMKVSNDYRRGLGDFALLGASENDAFQKDFASGADFSVEQRGFLEMVVQLHCFEKLDAVAGNVKKSGALLDMVGLARQDVLQKDLNLKMKNKSVDNLTWRLANMAADVTAAGIRLALSVAKVVQARSGMSVLAAAKLVVLAPRISGVLSYVADSLSEAEQGVSDAGASLLAAQNHVKQLEGELQFYVDAANEAQKSEVMP